jgi:hypothetical protein
MLFVVQDAVHQAQMLEAVTINNEPFGSNISPDENLPCLTTFGVLDPNVMLEQTLDAVPVLASQQVSVCRQTFKGGILKLAIKIKGWEMPGGWKAYCSANLPQIMASSTAP